jgi:hypothetical protein
MAKSKAVFICLLWFFISLPIHTAFADDGYCVRVTAASYVGIKEKGGNNQSFTKWSFRQLLAENGWKPGYAWCSFFVKAMLNECGIPNTITGWSPTAYNKKDVIFTDGKFYKSFNDGDVLVMTLSYADKYGSSRYKGIGHTGIVDRIGQNSVRTIEGNTNEQGMRDSRTTDGVYYKIRPLTKKLHITRWAKYQN